MTTLTSMVEQVVAWAEQLRTLDPRLWIGAGILVALAIVVSAILRGIRRRAEDAAEVEAEAEYTPAPPPHPFAPFVTAASASEMPDVEMSRMGGIPRDLLPYLRLQAGHGR